MGSHAFLAFYRENRPTAPDITTPDSNLRLRFLYFETTPRPPVKPRAGPGRGCLCVPRQTTNPNAPADTQTPTERFHHGPGSVTVSPIVYHIAVWQRPPGRRDSRSLRYRLPSSVPDAALVARVSCQRSRTARWGRPCPPQHVILRASTPNPACERA